MKFKFQVVRMKNYLRLFKSNSKNKSHIAENYISFEKLKSLYTKIAVCNSLARNVEISMLNSIDKFIEKVFIYHCYILQKDNSVLLILKISELKHLVAKFHLETSLIILISLKETA